MRCHQHLFAGTLAPAREVNDNIAPGGSGYGDLESQLMAFVTNVNLIVPVVAALAVIVIAIIVICVIKSKNTAITKGMFMTFQEPLPLHSVVTLIMPRQKLAASPACPSGLT